MVIVNSKAFSLVKDRTIYSINNYYISSIEYINNNCNEVLLKTTRKYYIEYFNLSGGYHNPIEPAYKRFRCDGTVLREEYYINGKYYNSKEHFKKALNDYHKL